MRHISLIAATIVAVFVSVVTCYPEGAPPEACESLKPSHDDHEAQNSAAPYSIATDKSRVRAGEEVLVTISGRGGETFRGFIMVAREPGKEATNLGQFASGENSAPLTCNTDSDAATHTSREDKSEVLVSWIAPSDYTGKVAFKATVVHAYEQYWTGITSNQITVY